MRPSKTIANMRESVGVGVTTPALSTPAPANDRYTGITRSKDVASIPLERITPDPAQPRKEFERASLLELSLSLVTHGQLQPIRVRWSEEQGVYVIISGERRYRAATLAGLAQINATIVDGKTAGAILKEQLVENALREGLTPMEQARAYQQLMNLEGLSQADLARELSISQASVTRSLALLELPSTVQEQVEQGALSASVAYEVAKAPVQEQEAIARAASEDRLSRSQVVELRQRKTTQTFQTGACTVKVSGPPEAVAQLVSSLKARAGEAA